MTGTNISKKDIASQVALRTGHSQRQAAEVLDAALAVIGETVATGGKVTLHGFGTFDAADRGERLSRNPQTGEPVHVPAQRVARFKSLKGLKDLVNGRTAIQTGQSA